MTTAVRPSRYELFDDLDELVYECDTLDEAAIAAKDRFEHCVALQLDLFENDKHGFMRLVGWFAASRTNQDRTFVGF